MLQQLLRRLVFDVPLLTDYCKMPLRVGNRFLTFFTVLYLVFISLPPVSLLVCFLCAFYFISLFSFTI